MLQLTCTRGNTALLCIHCTNPDGTPINLENFTLSFLLKRSTQDLDSAAVFSGSSGAISILGPSEDGVAQVTIPAAGTEVMLLHRPYFWSLQLEDDINEPFSITGLLTATFNAAH